MTKNKMEIGDILIEKEIRNEWLQFAGKEEGFTKYVRDGEIFIFKKIGKNKYQLYDICIRAPDYVAVI